MKENNKLIISGIVVLAIVAGFFGGVYYQKNQSVNSMGKTRADRNDAFTQDRGSGMGMNDRPGSDMRGGVISGEISNKDESGMTIKMADGSSKIILVNNDTKYTISSEADSTKVVVGEKVAVFGESNSDGSVTASSIELNPAMRGQLAK